MRPFRSLGWGIVVACIAYAAATYGTLPARIPVHFGLDGQADRFSDKSLVSWFALPGLMLALVLLFEFLTRAMRTRPELLNVPDKERFVRLPPRFREPVDAIIATMMDTAALAVVAILGLVQWHTMQAAFGRPGVPAVLLALMPLPVTLVVLLQVSRITTAIGDAERRWKDAGSPTA